MLISPGNYKPVDTTRQKMFHIRLFPCYKIHNIINYAPDKIRDQQPFDIWKKGFLPPFQLLHIKISCRCKKERYRNSWNNIAEYITCLIAKLRQGLRMDPDNHDCAHIPENIYGAVPHLFFCPHNLSSRPVSRFFSTRQIPAYRNKRCHALRASLL